MRAFFSLGALAALLLAGCGGGVSSVRFTDFEAGKSVAGMPIAGTDLATLKQQAAALPAEVFVDRVGERITGGPEVYHATILRTDAPLYDDGRRRDVPVTLEWVFEGSRLVAVGWRGATEDINGTRDKTARASYKVFDQAAHARVMAREAVRDREVAARQSAAAKIASDKEAALGDAQLAELDRTKVSPLTLLNKPGFSRFLARTAKLEAEAPFTAAGIYYHLKFSISVDDVNDALTRHTRDGLLRALLPACGRAMPLVDWGRQVPETAYWFRGGLSANAPPGYRYCMSDGRLYQPDALKQHAVAAGRTLYAVTVGPRSISDVKRAGNTRSTSTVSKNFTVQEANPAREAALAPLRELDRRLGELRSELAAVEKDIETAKANRGCDKFEGVDPGKTGANSRVGGPVYSKVQCGSAVLQQGQAERRAAELRPLVAAQEKRIADEIQKLPPAQRPVMKTSTTTKTDHFTIWTAKVRQRITLATSPPIVLDEPLSVRVEIESNKGEAEATRLLLGEFDREAAYFLERPFAATMEEGLKKGTLRAPPINPRLTGEAAQTERRWAEYFFANGSAEGLWPPPTPWNW